jgi:hypothetical protein
MKKIVLYLILLIPLLGYGQTRNISNMVQPTTSPTIVLSALSLTAFTNQTGTASSTHSLTVTFNNTSNAGAISVPSWAQVSVNGGSYSTSFTGLANGSYSLLVRVSASTASGSYGPSNIVFTGTGATTQNCSISATVSSASPTLSVSPTTVTIPATISGTQSSSVAFYVTGTNLPGTTITAPAPANTLLSTDNSSFTTSVTIPISGGSVTNYPVYVVTPSSAAPGSYTGIIQLTTTGISGTVNDTANGTVNSSSGVTLFYFSRTAKSAPTISGTTTINVYGDPYYNVLTGSGNGITISTGNSRAWQAFGSPLVASNDSLGTTGWTNSAFPDSLGYHGFFNASGSNRLGDSTNQTLSNPNLTATGLSTSKAYTVKIYQALNGRYSGFHSNIHVTIVGSTTQISSTYTLLNNNTAVITFTVTPDGTGTIRTYLFTDGASTTAINCISGESFQ